MSNATTPGTRTGVAGAELIMTTIDSADPVTLGAFYAELLGWDVLHSQDEYSMIGDGHTALGFGRVDGYVPPAWPGEPTEKQFHLDFYVDDVDEAAAFCAKRGATVPDFQPGEGRWRVLLDPDGRPFCLCPRTPEG